MSTHDDQQQIGRPTAASKRRALRLAMVMGVVFLAGSFAVITARIVVSRTDNRACAMTSESKDALRRHGSSESEWTRRLSAGQSATFGPDGVTIGTVSREEVERRFSLDRKVLYLNGTLSEAVAEFNQHNVRKFQIVSDNLKQMRIAGRFEVTDPENFIEALSHLGITHSIVAPDAPVDIPVLLSER